MTANHAPLDDAYIAEQLSWVKLSAVPTVGNHTFCQLLTVFGLPEQVFNASESQLKQVVSAKTAQHIKSFANDALLETTRQWLSAAQNHLVTIADDQYPQQLLEVSDPPAILYAKGNLSVLKQPCLGIVGGRNATKQGEQNAESFAEALSLAGYCIVSGMALGIDGAAHRGALTGSGKTIAVIGTGLDIVYPAKHRTLAHQIADSGLILSEFPLGTPSMPGNFPKRNRIISGLSQGCLVVEANTNSGSLITAKLAAEQGREVFAIPGSIHAPMAKGCHQLIKQGAKLVENTQDILEELPEVPQVSETSRDEPTSESDVTDNALLQYIDFAPTSLDQMMQLSGLNTQEVTASLMLLVLDNQVEELPGGLYQRLQTR